MVEYHIGHPRSKTAGTIFWRLIRREYKSGKARKRMRREEESKSSSQGQYEATKLKASVACSQPPSKNP